MTIDDGNYVWMLSQIEIVAVKAALQIGLLQTSGRMTLTEKLVIVMVIVVCLGIV
jgi:hypothetical protein